MKKLGILGGTFDPIHLGHLRTAEEIGQDLELEKVYLIPSASPPHKTGKPVAGFQDRLHMVLRASDRSPILDALDLEGKRPGLSYSIETLREMRSSFPDSDLFFILGTDAFSEIMSWKEYKRLFDYAHFVIIRRAGFRLEKAEEMFSGVSLNIKRTSDPDVFTAPSGKNIIFKSTTLLDISSTRIRRMIRDKKSIRFLVPGPVQDYIIEKQLYERDANTR